MNQNQDVPMIRFISKKTVRPQVLRILIWLSLLLFLVVVSCGRSGMQITTYTVTHVVDKLPLDTLDYLYRPAAVRVGGQDICIADQMNNRVVILSRDFQSAKVIGSAGKAPAEFLEPSLAIRRQQYIFVADLGNKRFQIFNENGKYERSFRANFLPWSKFGVNDALDLFIGTPGDGQHLLAEYNQKGDLIASFGDPVSMKNPRDQFNANVLSTAVDNQDNVYVAFYELPIVRKYDRTGHLVWETSLEQIPAVRERVKAIKKKKLNEGRRYLSMSLILDIVCFQNRVYVLLSLNNHLSNIYGLDAKTGKLLERVDTQGNEYWKHSISFIDNKLYWIDRLNCVLVEATRSDSSS